MHYVCKLKNEDEKGERDLKIAQMLLKYGAQPNRESSEVCNTILLDKIILRLNIRWKKHRNFHGEIVFWFLFAGRRDTFPLLCPIRQQQYHDGVV